MPSGERGEKIAAEFLRRLGYHLITRNYSCPLGEIDIIAADGDTVVFVEVKSRTSADAADPEIGIHYRKRCRITLAAKTFIAAKRLHDRAYRFDVIAIVLPDHSEPQIEHFIDAFAPTPR